LDYSKAINFNPKHADAYHNRAVVYGKKGQYDRAIRNYEQAMRIGGSSEVKSYQRWLKKAGCYNGAIDGKYSSGTRAALKACVKH